MKTNNELNQHLYNQREYGFQRTPYNSEFEKYHAIQIGDVDTVAENFKTIRANFNSGKGVLSDDPVRNTRYHMIISTAITARICIDGGMPHNDSYALSDIYIQAADKCNTHEGILDLFEEMHLDYAKRMRDLKKEDVVSIHVRKCIDYIRNHIHEKITIDLLSEHVGRNPSYLSSLFAKETGMSIHTFVINERVESAKSMLIYSDLSFLSIANTLGFSSQSAFISTFKKMTGMTPKEYKNANYARGL